MKGKSLFLISFIFVIVMASALVSAVDIDQFNDASINSTLWDTTTRTGDTLDEGSGYLNLESPGSGGVFGTTNVTMKSTFDIFSSFASNVTYKVYEVQTTAGGNNNEKIILTDGTNQETIVDLASHFGTGQYSAGAEGNFYKIGNTVYHTFNGTALSNFDVTGWGNIRIQFTVQTDPNTASHFLRMDWINATNLGASISTSLVSPANASTTTESSIVFNATVSPGSPTEITNATIHIWNSTNDLINSTTNILLGSSANSSLWTIKNLDLGTYYWNVLGCGDAVGSSACEWASSNYTFTYGFITNQTYYVNKTAETEKNFLSEIITIPDIFIISSANLIWNGTSSSATVSNLGGNAYNLSKVFYNPLEAYGNISYHWEVNLNDSSTQNTQANIQEVYLLNMSLCGSPYTVPYLNITFKDESDLSIINATIPSSSFGFYLGDGSISKNLTYINNDEMYSYEFCFTPSSKTVFVDPYIQYASTGYPQRIYEPSTLNLTNSTTTKVLYLLNSNDGLYVTFQVINSAEQSLSGVTVNATRSISGETVTVGTGTTGADGTVTFWLNPDYTHTLTFSKEGFTTYSLSLTPTQSSYTITLAGGENQGTNDYTQGIKTFTAPTNGELFNDTTYLFEFNVTSSYWDLDSFGFSLRLPNGSIVGSDSSTTGGSPATFSYDVNNQSLLYMDYYWIIEGNRSEGNRYWIITNTEYTNWSIKNLITDLSSYLDSGLFGIGVFGKYLIIFIILFVIVGVMSYKYGFVSPMSVTGTIFAVVFFLDIVAGLIPPIRGIDHVLTYLAALILTVIFIREVSR